MSLHIAIIAGEVSGDMLGADLLEALTQRYPDATFSGIGGAHMKEHGFRSLFPMQEIALMGFSEILPHIFRLKRRIKQTITHLRDTPPDLLITIDSPGFTFRVVKALQDTPFPKVHYVAPTVWAYKPKRALKTAKLFDHLLTLLPFEPPYFTKEGLRTDFIGHPTVWRHRGVNQLDNHGEMRLLMLPGSRAGELKRHMPLFMKSYAALRKETPTLEAVMVVPPFLSGTLQHMLQDYDHDIEVHSPSNEHEKIQLFATCTAALAKSGTISLELACAGVPMVTTYKMSGLSAMLMRRLIRTPYVNLVNILAGREVIPELIQEAATVEALNAKLHSLLTDDSARHAQRSAFEDVLVALGRDADASPSDKAAALIAEHLNG